MKVFLVYDIDELVDSVFSRKTDAIQYAQELHGEMSDESTMRYVDEFEVF